MKKILIVDDESFIRLLIEQSLEELEDQGIEILEADNGQEALELIKEHHPGLVFLDVMLPKLNGFDICYKVKHELGLSDIIVILLTAKGQEVDRQRGEAAGANLYMTKPFDPDELLQKAREALQV